MDFRQASRNTWKTEGRSNIFAAGARAHTLRPGQKASPSLSLSLCRFHRLFSSSSLDRRLDFVTPRANKGIVAVKRNIIGEEKERREIVDGGEVEETERGWIVMVEEGWIYERKGSSPRTIRNIFRENFLLAKPYGPYGVRFQNTRPAPIREKRILSFSLSPLCLSLVSFCFSIVCKMKEGGFYIYTFFFFCKRIFVFFDRGDTSTTLKF